MLTRRCGFTLVETVVSLAVSATVFGAFALVVAQQERAHADLARRIRARAQMDEGIGALAAELRGASPSAGDIRPGAALDSSIELRTTVGSAVICGTEGGVVSTALASYVAPPEVADTVWAYAGPRASPRWIPFAVARVGVQPAEAPPGCSLPQTAAVVVLPGRRAALPRYTLEISDSVGSPVSIAAGTPIRVTRPVRYSLYRAPDQRWYLGRREWSVIRGGFETIQPVSGPYGPYAPSRVGASGLELAYFDYGGAPIEPGATQTERIARVRVTVRAQLGSANSAGGRRRTQTLAIAFRDRR